MDVPVSTIQRFFFQPATAERDLLTFLHEGDTARSLSLQGLRSFLPLAVCSPAASGQLPHITKVLAGEGKPADAQLGKQQHHFLM